MEFSLVAINIIDDNKLINKNGLPLMFYWDKEKDINISLKESKEFRQFIIDNICNISSYTKSKISYFYYIYNTKDNSEVYNEYINDIQKWLPLKEIEETQFYEEYLINYMNYLYNCVYKKDFEFREKIFLKEDLKDIYNKIRERYNESRVNRNTLINYLRSQLLSKENLSSENTDFIISKINEIL